MEIKKEENEDGGNKGSGDDEVEEIFDLDLTPNHAQTGLNMDNYIKLKGEMIPAKMMNLLYDKINKEFDCEIILKEGKLAFNVIFNNAPREEVSEEVKERLKQLGYEINEENEENELIKKDETIIQVKLFESYNGGYLLRFVRKGGEPSDYFDKMEKISSIVKKVISN